MAKLLSVIFFVCLTAAASNPAEAQFVGVDGYVTGHGTYVAPHIRTAPDGQSWNNLRPR